MIQNKPTKTATFKQYISKFLNFFYEIKQFLQKKLHLFQYPFDFLFIYQTIYFFSLHNTYPTKPLPLLQTKRDKYVAYSSMCQS